MNDTDSLRHGWSFFEGDLEQLRCFYYAALYRSFTRAAERLSTGQPTVSNRIKQLERLLGTRLFRRERRGVTLTEDGQSLLELTAAIVEGADGLTAELARRRGIETAEVQLAAGQELLLHLAAPALRAYRHSHPEVRLVAHSRLREQVFEMVERDEVDFGIAGQGGVPGNLAFTEVLADELVLIAPRRHELASLDALDLADIARYPVLMPDRASSTRRMIEGAFADAGLSLNVAMELERWHVIKEFVALEFGVSIVPRFSVAGDERRLAIRSLRHRFGPLSYGTVARKGRRISSHARELIDLVMTQARSTSHAR
jgi:DNA-binding transcriptional LysR family regulator